MVNNNGKLNYIAITCIIRKENKYLICKRSPNEKLFPLKWCVPGGKIEASDYINSPKDTTDHWLNIFEKVIQREIKEETNLNIKNIDYVSSLVLIRPDGFPTIIVSLFADFDSGQIKLSEDELIDYAWVSTDELSNYDIIENIPQQIIHADKKFKKD